MPRLRWNSPAAVCLILQIVAHGVRADDRPTFMKGGPFEVERVLDVPYSDAKDADPGKHKLDLYLPKGKTGFPVLFFVHGGGWSMGDRKWFSTIGPVFARNGVGTVVVSYRLSPKHVHPAHIEDVARAFAWTHKNIAKHGGRPDRIFVTGQSAGGHLAALLAVNPKYLKPFGLTPKDIRGDIPVSGVYRIEAGFLKRAFGTDPARLAEASPIRHVEGDEPPFLIVHADKDMPGCAVMSKRFRDALAEKKVPAELLEISDRNHVSIMTRWMLSDEDPTSQAILKFIAKYSDLELKAVPGRDGKKS